MPKTKTVRTHYLDPLPNVVKLLIYIFFYTLYCGHPNLKVAQSFANMLSSVKNSAI